MCSLRCSLLLPRVLATLRLVLALAYSSTNNSDYPTRRTMCRTTLLLYVRSVAHDTTKTRFMHRTTD